MQMVTELCGAAPAKTTRAESFGKEKQNYGLRMKGGNGLLFGPQAHKHARTAHKLLKQSGTCFV